MVLSSAIADDRRSVFPYDRRRSQNFLRSAIRDRLRSYGNQPLQTTGTDDDCTLGGIFDEQIRLAFESPFWPKGREFEQSNLQKFCPGGAEVSI